MKNNTKFITTHTKFKSSLLLNSYYVYSYFSHTEFSFLLNFRTYWIIVNNRSLPAIIEIVKFEAKLSFDINEFSISLYSVFKKLGKMQISPSLVFFFLNSDFCIII